MRVKSTLDGIPFHKAFDVLVDLHQRRFVSKGERGVFSDPRTNNFLSSAIESLCAKNRAEILIGYVEEAPFVAHLYLLGEKGPQLYQSGANPEFMKLEPGHLMFSYAVRKAIENGHTELDFLRGDEAYKSFWGAERQPLLKTRFVSRSVGPTIINHSYRALRYAKVTGTSIWSNLGLTGESPAGQ